MESYFRGQPKPLTPLDPSAPFAGHLIGIEKPTVGQFWTWAFSDLRSNATRGILAEFLVAWALGCRGGLRSPWDDFDVLAPGGVRVEVKASGYLQSWTQKRPSRISFGRLTGRTWNSQTGAFGEVRELRADIYVFAVHTCQDADRYDALDLDAWRFFVLPRRRVELASARSISLATVKSLGADEVTFEQLRSSVLTAAAKAGE